MDDMNTSLDGLYVDLMKKNLETRKNNRDIIWSEIIKMRNVNDFIKFIKLRPSLKKFFIEDFNDLKDFYLENHKLINQFIYYMDEKDKNNKVNILYDNNLIDDREIFFHIYTNSYLGNKCAKRLPYMDYSFGCIYFTSKFGNEIDGDHSEKLDIICEKYKDELDIISTFNEKFTFISQTIRNMKIFNEPIEMENDFPELRRGNICRGYTPIKDLSNDLEIGGVVKLFNPRKKIQEKYNVISKLDDSYIAYKLENPKGEFIYVMKHENMKETYDNLSSFNRELFSGWWNRSLEMIN